ncbi:MAG: aldo/keto reductase [Marinifilaceae bacterium]
MEDLVFSNNRYDKMHYRRCGRSGLMLPRISMGLWHNFGENNSIEQMERLIFSAFDNGITSFDLANNYGPPPGAAETNFGRILKRGFGAYRDEMVIATKAGHRMWEGPYGEWGSRKHLISSIDASLKRLGVEYVDIFYSHRPDPHTPMEETMRALADIVKSGKALYIGLSKYSHRELKEANAILTSLNCPAIAYQGRYSMFERTVESQIIPCVENQGMGFIAFSPLAQGILTNKYLHGIPEGSRAAGDSPFLLPEHLTQQRIDTAHRLNMFAKERGQCLSQLALSWIMRDDHVISSIIGASCIEQLLENIKSIEKAQFQPDELDEVERILGNKPWF